MQLSLEQAEQFKFEALKYGVLFLGILLLGATVAALVKGETWGGTGKGRVFRKEEPFYFAYMIIARTLLGIVALAAVFFFSFKR